MVGVGRVKKKINGDSSCKIIQRKTTKENQSSSSRETPFLQKPVLAPLVVVKVEGRITW